MKWMFSDPHPFVAKALSQVSCCKRMRFLCLIPKYSKRLYSMQPLQSKTCPTGLLEFWQVCHEVLPPRWVDSGCINDISHLPLGIPWPNSSFSKMYNFSRIFWGPIGQSLAVFDPIPLGCSMLYPQSSSWTAACSRGFWASLSPSWCDRGGDIWPRYQMGPTNDQLTFQNADINGIKQKMLNINWLYPLANKLGNGKTQSATETSASFSGNVP